MRKYFLNLEKKSIKVHTDPRTNVGKFVLLSSRWRKLFLNLNPFFYNGPTATVPTAVKVDHIETSY